MIDTLETIGLMAITAGLFVLHPGLGLLWIGFLCLLYAHLEERRRKEKPEAESTDEPADDE